MAEVHPLLHEFSALDPALVEGMTGEQRRPITAAYWHTADPAVRMGDQAETFLEFNSRVSDFVGCHVFRIVAQCSRDPAPMPTSRDTTSSAALSGGSNLATALFLNACPYRANSVLHRRPRG